MFIWDNSCIEGGPGKNECLVSLVSKINGFL